MACGRPTPTKPSSLPRTTASPTCSPVTSRSPSATSAGRKRSACLPSRSSARWRPSSGRRVGGRGRWSTCQTTKTSSWRRFATSPGWRSANTSAAFAAASPSNLDLPMSAVELLRLSMHETYPGHHTERSAKDHLLVRGRRSAGGDAGAGADPSVARVGGDRRARARRGARGGRRVGARRGHRRTPASSSTFLMLSPSNAPSSRAGGRRSTRH